MCTLCQRMVKSLYVSFPRISNLLNLWNLVWLLNIQYTHCRKIYLYEPLVNFSKSPSNLSCYQRFYDYFGLKLLKLSEFDKHLYRKHRAHKIRYLRFFLSQNHNSNWKKSNLSCNCVIINTNKGGQINYSVIRSWTLSSISGTWFK
jgi:hypothetical protein